MNAKALTLVRATGVATAVLIYLLAVAEAPSTYGASATLIVDNTTDDGSKNDCNSATANDCSLRGAIGRSTVNGNPADVDVISFAQVGSGIKTITITSLLPAITQPLTIDGSTAPAGTVEVTAAASPLFDGFVIEASDVTINNLIINKFDGAAVLIEEDPDGGSPPLNDITISNNRIGLHKTTDTAQGNGQGVWVNRDVSNLVVTGNVIGGNDALGVLVSNSVGPTTIQGNHIGVTPASVDVGNVTTGLVLSSSSNVTIGGGGSARNFIAGNALDGISMESVSDVLITSNRIGTAPNGQARTNGRHGIQADGASALTISTNTISGNGLNGVDLFNVNNTSLVFNFIGVNVTGIGAIPNGESGVVIASSSSVTIAGNGPDRPNVISGNKGSGVEIQDSTATLTENHIGTNANGDAAIPNGLDGVTVAGNASSVTLQRNIISGNDSDGVEITDSPGLLFGHSFRGNIIGLDKTGESPVPNTNGIQLFGNSQASIGGPTAADRNVISGNIGAAGIALTDDAFAGIEGNYIGLTADGTHTAPNARGVSISGNAGARIGDGTPAGGNYISGNTNDGVLVIGGSVDIDHSFIGVQGDGVTPAGNGRHGLNLAAGSAGLLLTNTFANNGQTGVLLASTTTATEMRVNSIHSNGGLGIDLGGGGVTANDAGDADTGPNNLANYPEIISVFDDPAGDSVHWTLSTDHPNTEYIVELFVSAACDGSGFGEGAAFVADVNATTDAQGNIDTVSPVSAGTFAIGEIVTATSTDHFTPNGTTSEFSECAVVLADPGETPTPVPTDTPLVTPTGGPASPTPTSTPPVTATATPEPTPTPTAVAVLTQGDLDCDGDVDEDDVVLLLLFAAETPGSEDTRCDPDIGGNVQGSDFGWGDVNCDGAIDGLDVLALLLFDTGLEAPESGVPCEPVGSALG